MSLRCLLKSHLAPYRRAIVLVLVLQAGQTTAGLLLPGLNTTLINEGVLLGDQTVIWRMGTIMLLVSLVQVVLLTGAVWCASKVAMAFGHHIRRDLFNRVIRYSTREIGRFGTPSLITNDSHQIQTLMAMVGTMMITAPLTMIAGIVFAVVVQDIGNRCRETCARVGSADVGGCRSDARLSCRSQWRASPRLTPPAATRSLRPPCRGSWPDTGPRATPPSRPGRAGHAPRRPRCPTRWWNWS